MEELAREERHAAVVLCDRGTLDELCYGAGSPTLADETSLSKELARYEAVVHLRAPALEAHLNHASWAQAELAAREVALDTAISAAWARHPRRVVIDYEVDFVRKLARAVEAIWNEVPACCAARMISQHDETSPRDGRSSNRGRIRDL